MTSLKYFVLLGFGVITRHHGGVKVPGLEDFCSYWSPGAFPTLEDPELNWKTLVISQLENISVPESVFN